MDFEILAVFCYGRESIAFRIGLCSTIDAELQSLAAYVFAKKLNTFDIIVSVVESACNALVYSEACNSSSSCVQNYDEQGEVRQQLKPSYWATLLNSVGQTFPGGAEQFRTTLLKMSLVESSHDKKLVKSLILNQVRDKPLIKPKEIVDIFKSDYGVTLGYYFAYASKELALKQIYGDDKLSYSNLRWFAGSLIRTNPGSRVVLEVNPVTNKFERLFISFEACIHGFEFCRPLLFLDGTFLKSKYKGCLLAATGKNGNEGIFPLAYAVVVSEDDANWLWFLQNLKTVVSPVRRLTFISDRHPGLLLFLAPEEQSAFCLV
ncbi:hypothetical protein BVC80_1623g18 [Macleaya cordata]|uniref:MULE transposase domain-containing protein n=1 Tax=Macleaya cordata TaxID=56857 RepID=A0A200Q1C3_MACCD|nr:hypothetical protein BVC80_1623g18 [Macleaya cordata]